MLVSKNNALRSMSLGMVFLFLIGCVSIPEEYTETQLIDRFIEVANLYNQTDENPKMIRLSVVRQKVVNLSASQREFLERSIELSFDAETVLNEVKTSIRQSMT